MAKRPSPALMHYVHKFISVYRRNSIITFCNENIWLYTDSALPIAKILHLEKVTTKKCCKYQRMLVDILLETMAGLSTKGTA